MPMIYVRAKKGRRVYFERKIIPEDKFVPVTDTPYIRRLVRHWGDLEMEGGDESSPETPGPAQEQPLPPRSY